MAFVADPDVSFSNKDELVRAPRSFTPFKMTIVVTCRLADSSF